MVTAKKEVISFRCPSAMKNELIRYSKLARLNVSEVIRRALVELMSCSDPAIDGSTEEAVQSGCGSQVKNGK